SGRVRLRGRDITGQAPYRIARAGIGFVPEDRRVFAELTVWENLEVAGRVAGRRGHWTVETVYALFPVLHGLRDRMAGFLSGGEQQMLTIGRTLMGYPDLLLLDEPSEGLAPIVVDALADALVRIRDEAGMSIILVEQRIDLALSFAEDAIVLDRGRIVYRGGARELQADEAAKARLLSVSAASA
ncbi:MAG: ATP-binding cassette domain-containing protein, partial [Caulobacteraceae bacterium]|nr:ATP-binding cassette domain-containing protein [Caulobacteraceae bacterium]